MKQKNIPETKVPTAGIGYVVCSCGEKVPFLYPAGDNPIGKAE